jgi:predicted TPR repeat methyltransferase
MIELDAKDENNHTKDGRDSVEGGVKLLSVGRFGNSEEYIRTLADKHHFRVARAARGTPLRFQNDMPVRSITFTLVPQRKKDVVTSITATFHS